MPDHQAKRRHPELQSQKKKMTVDSSSNWSDPHRRRSGLWDGQRSTFEYVSWSTVSSLVVSEMMWASPVVPKKPVQVENFNDDLEVWGGCPVGFVSIKLETNTKG